MARSGIDYTQVAKAALQLAEQGRPISVDSVRVQLGGTGSRSTIAPLVKRWKAEHAQADARAQTGLPADLLQSVQRLYDEVRQQFAEELMLAKEAAQSRVDTLERSVDALVKEKAQSDQLCRKLSETTDIQAADLTIVRDELHAERNAHRELTISFSALKQRQADSASEISNLRDQVAQASRQFEHFQQAAQARFDEARQASELRLAEAATGAVFLREQLQRAQNDVQAAVAKLDATTSALSSAAALNEQQRNTIGQLNDEIASKHEIINRSDEHLRKTEESLSALRNSCAATKLQLSEVGTRLATIEGEKVLLEHALAAADERARELLKEIVAVSRHNAKIEGELAHYRQVELKEQQRAGPPPG